MSAVRTLLSAARTTSRRGFARTAASASQQQQPEHDIQHEHQQQQQQQHSSDRYPSHRLQTQLKPTRPSPPSNPQLAFPCLDKLETRSALLQQKDRSAAARTTSSSSGPEPSYTPGEHLSFRSHTPLVLDWGGVLREYTVAYETWGSLNADRSNAILLHTGLSASSHAHSTPSNPKPGWWEKFIGPGLALDTDKFFVICTNVIGGCYGSTGPSSFDPADGQRYATRFPILTMMDMVRAQFRLLEHLEIEKLYASVGASMGGMQSLTAATLFPEKVGRVVSISGCARSHPYSIAMRHTQRQGSL
jgi:hypothetical protein